MSAGSLNDGGTGEEEDGDSEARTAVAALLALTSVTDFSRHTEYEDDYLMEEDELSVEIIEDGSSYQATQSSSLHTDAFRSSYQATQHSALSNDAEIHHLQAVTDKGNQKIQKDITTEHIQKDISVEIKPIEDYGNDKGSREVGPILVSPLVPYKSLLHSNPTTPSNFKGFPQGKTIKSDEDNDNDDTYKRVAKFDNEKKRTDYTKSVPEDKLNNTPVSSKLIRIPEKHRLVNKTPTSSKLDKEQIQNRKILLEGSIRSEFSTPKSNSIEHHRSLNKSTSSERCKVDKFHASDNRERAIAKPLMKSLESDSSSSSDSDSNDDKDDNEDDSSSSDSDSDSSSSNSDDGTSSDSDSDSDEISTNEKAQPPLKQKIEVTKLIDAKITSNELETQRVENIVKPNSGEFKEKLTKPSKVANEKSMKITALDYSNPKLKAELNIKSNISQKNKNNDEGSILKTVVEVKGKNVNYEEKRVKAKRENKEKFDNELDRKINKKTEIGKNVSKKNETKVNKHNELNKSSLQKSIKNKENDTIAKKISENDVSLGEKIIYNDNASDGRCSIDANIPKKNPVKRVTEIIITTDNGKKTTFGHLGGSNKENNYDERSKTNIVIRRVGVEGQEETITNKDLRITAGDRDANETITTKLTKGSKNLKQSNKKNVSGKTEKQIISKNKSQDEDDRPQVKLSGVDLVQQVAAAFAQQLSAIQASQLKQMSRQNSKDESRWEMLDSSIAGGVMDVDDDAETEDLPLPIQAEVVMSDGSDSDLDYQGYQAEEDDQCITTEYWEDSEKCDNQELVNYLRTFVNGGGGSEVVSYPPLNNEVPCDGRDLTQWQLEDVHLPPFTPNVAPPSWLRLTIPAEGYRCHSCGDTFFIESSLVQHRERRSIWINLECGPCDAKLTFYNRCALKDHLREHVLRGEEVDEETVEVRSLPLQLSRLLQPIMVPIPEALRGGLEPHNVCKNRSRINKMPALKRIHNGKATPNRTSNRPEYSYSEEEYENDDEEDYLDMEENAGMKRLSPRKKTIKCYLCERMFHSVRELMGHMRTDQPYSDQRVECRKCQLVLPSVCAAKAHILTHPPANSSNISVCPECGSRCDGPRDFVHHLNTCGHQFRRSGIVCDQCQVCFFKTLEDFFLHWVNEHCAKSYECVVCHSTFESLVFHKCSSPGQQVLATFKCLLTCPMCPETIMLHTQDEKDTNNLIRNHLAEFHPITISRVHYVYKSKFCTNAFRSKDELRAHHDREHRRDNHYRTKTCTLHHEVLGYQHQYFNGQEPRNAFVTLPVALSAEELHEARIRDVPTVSSVIDKALFPEISKSTKEGNKASRQERSTPTKPNDAEGNENSSKETPAKKDLDELDKLRPTICYRCGYTYGHNKEFRKHKRKCDGENTERQCNQCEFSATGEEFARHCLNHIQEGAIICIYCNGLEFSNSSDLEQHFELHVHEQFSYPASCAFCELSLPDVPTALTHINEEHNPEHLPFHTSEFECERCGRHFHGERGLNVHLGRCTVGTPSLAPNTAGCRQCQVCTKALTPETFGRHIVNHLEEGLLVCSLCDGRTLPSSMALLHHLEEHAQALLYPSNCPMCNTALEEPTTALTHLKEEHGFGNLECTDCDMHYNFTYQLQRHTDIVHKICTYAKRRYICWICRAYDHVKKETLMNHFRIVHGLDREQVDEKAMIRTRGQGTMPTSTFIPTKPLGTGEIPGSELEPQNEQKKSKSLKDKTKPSPTKNPTLSESLVKTSSKNHDTSEPLTLTKKSVPDEEILPEENEIFPEEMDDNDNEDDTKLKEKTKVLIKRLPDSVLDEQSRSKRRKLVKKSKSSENISDTIERPTKVRKKKKKKAHKCPDCGFGTNYLDKFEKHVLKHATSLDVTETEEFVCEECSECFVTEPSLTRHMFFAHKSKIKIQSVSGDEGEEALENMMSVDQDEELIENENDTAEVTIGTKELDTDRMSKKIKEETILSKDLESEITCKIINKETILSKDLESEITCKKINKETILSKDLESEITCKKIHKETISKDLESEITCKKFNKETILTKDLECEIASNKIKKEKIVTEDLESDKTSKQNPEKRLNTGIEKVASVIKGKRLKSRKKLPIKVSKIEIEERDFDAIDKRCVVCKEEFDNSIDFNRHFRTHGMAFLKLGQKARPLIKDKVP